MSLWDDFLLTQQVSDVALAKQAQQTAVELSGVEGQLASQDRLIRSQARALHRLQTAVKILGELLVERGGLDAAGLDARVDAALKAEADAQRAQAAQQQAARTMDAQLQAARREAQAQAPTQCCRCGKLAPYHTTYMTENGPCCASCMESESA